MSGLRFIAQRIITGEFLDFDLPFKYDSISWTLSGAGSFTGTLSPDTGILRAPDGRLLLEEWSTFLFIERDGEIIWGGIVIATDFTGEEWKVEAAGFSTYLHGLIYDGVFSAVHIDPADCFRELWRNAQNHPYGNLGVLVPSDTTTKRLGDEAYLKYDDGRISSLSFPDPTYVPQGAHIVDAKPYELNWWSSTDCGTEVDNLAKETPFDYIEKHFWIPQPGVAENTLDPDLVIWLYDNHWMDNGGGYLYPSGNAPSSARPVTYGEIPDEEWDRLLGMGWVGHTDDSVERIYPPQGYAEIAHIIRVHYPRTGRSRDDLAFIQGDNIIDVVSVTLHGDDYANEIIGLGAGEGDASLHRVNSLPDQYKLRRTFVYSDKSVAFESRLDSLIAAELAPRRNTLDIAEITVKDHPNAPIGSWALGDDITVQATLPWLGDIALQCRITEWSLNTDETATLTLVRSDSFRYGVTPHA